MATLQDVLDLDMLRLMRVDEFERLIEAGHFGEDEHLELLEGLVVNKAYQSPQHSFSVQRMYKALIRAVGDRGEVYCQAPVTLGEFSLPEPDIAVVPPDIYDRVRPSQALLVVEVALSSPRTDRGIKARIYARAAVPEYWIVNLRDQVVEVYAEPANGAYASTRVLTAGDTLVPTAFPDVHIAIRDILPRP